MNGSAVHAISGMVSLPMQQPNASYTVTWYSTTTDQPTSTHASTRFAPQLGKPWTRAH